MKKKAALKCNPTCPKSAGCNWFAWVVEWLPFASMVAIGMLIVGLLLSICGYGFDFTDEGYYLNWINTLYPVRDRQFGFIYHPLWLLVGEDVVLLRQANVLITLGLAFALSLLLLRGEERDGVSEYKDLVKLVGFAFGLASVAGACFLNFTTPNYNSLAFQSLLVATIGLKMADRSYSRVSVIGWILLGMGGWLAFMGKPTTAAALAFLSLTYVFITKRTRLALLGLAGSISFLMLLAFTFIADGSPLVFGFRLSEAIKDLIVIGAGQINWLRFDMFDYGRDPLLNKLFWFLLAYVCFGVIISARNAQNNRFANSSSITSVTQLVWLALIAMAVAASVMIGLDWVSWRNAGYFLNLPLAGICFGTLVGSVIVCRRDLSLSHDWRTMCSFVLYLLMPYAYAIGTGSNYWKLMQFAAFFWVCAGIIVMNRITDRDSRLRGCLLAIVVAQAIVVNGIVLSAERPYRQPQIFRQPTVEINLHPQGSPIRLSKDFADYITKLRNLTVENGFVPGTPVLDLTGHSPGALFAMGAKPIGAAWLSGGYPGSVIVAERILDRVPSVELKSAWVLTEPSGGRPLPDSLLDRYDLSLEEDYGLVAVISTPEGGDSRGTTQYLYKPGAASKIKPLIVEEKAFSIVLPSQAISIEALTSDEGLAHGWLSAGRRGEIFISGVKDQPGIMRLIAGAPGPERGESTRHVLLLKPSSTLDGGIPVISEEFFIEFQCELRSASNNRAGRVQLRLDGMNHTAGKSAAAQRWVFLGNNWQMHHVTLPLHTMIDGVQSILAWYPEAKGDVLELRKPRLIFYKFVKNHVNEID